MSIAELTTKIENLSAEDYNMVVMLVNRLAEKSEASGLKKLSEDELVEELSESIRKSNMGATKSAKAVSKSMREKFDDYMHSSAHLFYRYGASGGVQST